MTIFFFLTGLLQGLIIWAMGQAGLALLERARKERELAAVAPPEGWPPCGLIIPIAGLSPMTGMALKSLLSQDYPDYVVRIVLESANDPAAPLVAGLENEFPRLRVVIAGPAIHCGQKNHNILAGLAALPESVRVFAFCDSTHLARPDFLRCLIEPIARREAAITSGYHQVESGDRGAATLGYALSVLFMRLLQGMSILTQPWGGAMAMTKAAFVRYEVAKLWSTNVVDDCSLAGWLRGRGVHVRHVPGALLITRASAHTFRVWNAWLTRQILFLKFCMPGQWLGLGLVCFIMAGPPIWCALVCLRGVMGIGGGMAPFLALCQLCFVAWAIYGWRKLLPKQPASAPWIFSFFCACGMFALVYGRSFFQSHIIWANIRYKVGRGGKVEAMERLNEAPKISA
ncbi:MAG: glycosyltransferase [Desulfovibrio sp.]|nr:glycosyltransferase [Desulfovibrio sp.]